MSRTFRVDPHRALRRALAALLEGTVEGIAEEPWASVTLSGRRHRFRAVSPARRDRLAAIEEIEFDIPGHLVAEIIATGSDANDGSGVFEIEALTIATE